MSIRFAASKPVLRARIRPSSGSLRLPRTANDNGGSDGVDALCDTRLTLALRHFARHGLAAAPDAHDKALAAFAIGDERQFLHWRAICQALDRRLARQLPPLRSIANVR